MLSALFDRDAELTPPSKPLNRKPRLNEAESLILEHPVSVPEPDLPPVQSLESFFAELEEGAAADKSAESPVKSLTREDRLDQLKQLGVLPEILAKTPSLSLQSKGKIKIVQGLSARRQLTSQERLAELLNAAQTNKRLELEQRRLEAVKKLAEERQSDLYDDPLPARFVSKRRLQDDQAGDSQEKSQTRLGEPSESYFIASTPAVEYPCPSDIEYPCTQDLPSTCQIPKSEESIGEDSSEEDSFSGGGKLLDLISQQFQQRREERVERQLRKVSEFLERDALEEDELGNVVDDPAAAEAVDRGLEEQWDLEMKESRFITSDSLAVDRDSVAGAHRRFEAERAREAVSKIYATIGETKRTLEYDQVLQRHHRNESDPELNEELQDIIVKEDPSHYLDATFEESGVTETVEQNVEQFWPIERRVTGNNAAAAKASLPFQLVKTAAAIGRVESLSAAPIKLGTQKKRATGFIVRNN